MQTLLVFIHVVVALLLILIILMQQGSGGGLSGMFGGGGSMDDMFSSPSGDAFFRKATAVLATIFIITSLTLAVRTTRPDRRSLLEGVVDTPIEAPTEPAPGAEGLPAGIDLEIE